jgi:adenosylhomocysteine nucleosidase
VVVLTALNAEYRAVRAHLEGIQVSQHAAGTIFEEGTLTGSPNPVVLAVAGEGNQGAAILAERANSSYSPQALLFVGVAGALKDDIRIGDVVVATRVYAYHGGKESDEGFLTRPRSWEASHELEQLARHLDATGEWAQWLPDAPRDHLPTVHFKPVAAGEAVIGSRDSFLARQLHRGYNDAVAVEMESAGAAHAGHLGSLPVLTIRGISDEADAGKQLADAGGSQAAAAACAAAFAVALIRAMRPTDTARRPSGSPPGEPGAGPPAYVQKVSAQAGSTVFAVLHGDQTIHGAAVPSAEPDPAPGGHRGTALGKPSSGTRCQGRASSGRHWRNGLLAMGRPGTVPLSRGCRSG